MITLSLVKIPTVPLEAERICPDVTVGLDHESLKGLPVFHGKRQCRLDEFFNVEGSASDTIEIKGDAAKVKWIGRGMTRGKIKIDGNAGMHLGAHMQGGEIEVTGNASDWVGGEMQGGLIRIHGNAGGQIGAAYRGSMAGMTGGTIIVDGTAGLEIGMRMRRGTIVVGGRVRDFAGLQMKGGTIVLLSGAEIRTGAWMMRGTIISLESLALLPTFSFATQDNPAFIRVLARNLEALGIRLPFDPREGSYRLYSGDSSMPGKGEIFVWQPR